MENVAAQNAILHNTPEDRGAVSNDKPGIAIAVLPMLLIASAINRGSYFLPQRKLLVILSVLVAAYLVYDLNRHKSKLTLDWVGYLLLALSATGLVSSVWSIKPEQSIWSGAVLASYAIFYIAVRHIYRPADRTFWLYIVVLVGTLASFWGIVGVVFSMFPWSITVNGVPTAASFFEYPNALAVYVLMALPAGMELLKEARGNYYLTWLYFAVVLIMQQAVFLSFSRAGYLFMTFLIALYIIRSWRQRGMCIVLSTCVAIAVTSSALIQLLLGVGLASVTVFAASLMLYPVYGLILRPVGIGKRLKPLVIIGVTIFALLVSLVAMGEMQEIPQKLLDLVERQSLHTLSDSHRFGTWLSSVDTWRERSLSGWGAGTFYDAYMPHIRTSLTKFAHNIILQHMVELGLMGGTLAVSLYVGYAYWFHRRVFARGDIKHFVYPQAVAITCGMFLFQNLFDFTWYYPGITLLFLANLAISDAELDSGSSNIGGKHTERR